MIHRTLGQKLVDLFGKFPIVSVLGPRQSGKTTLVQKTFPDLAYVNMEDPVQRENAAIDPRSFLERYSDGLIIDEAQKVPELFSYLQLYADQKDRPGLYILTGSQQFLLNEKISQSLAGRVAITTLLPLTYRELIRENLQIVDVHSLIFQGFYPRIYRYNIEPKDFYPGYLQTYVERDVRQIKNITNLTLFQKFIKLCAGRVGQLLNISSLANDCGVSQFTAKQWLSLLEMSFIVYLQQPYYRNFGKRLVKAPKLYFYDTGLACYLLNIASSQQLQDHYAKGSLFENLIVNELQKQFFNRGLQPLLYFWRDKVGHEIDIIVEGSNDQLIPIEIKSGKTINKDFFKNLEYWKTFTKQAGKAYLVYGGAEDMVRKSTTILSWQNFHINQILNA
ncbi:MAG: ATP-binding protein [Pseudomonadota bacterium]